MSDFNSLKTTVNESKTTLASAAKTIRNLIQERNDALSAASPADVKAAAEETKAVTTGASLQTELETARLDVEEAIKEANATPVIVSKPKVAAPGPVAAPTTVYPVTLEDGTSQGRPNVSVTNSKDEASMRAAGYTIVVPPPTV